MNISTRITAFTLSAGLILGTAAASAQYGGPPPPPGAYGQGGWDAPPPEYQNEARRNGFHDGIEGARRDFENHRQPNPNNRDEFRHPNVPHAVRHEYKVGFRAGYQAGVMHLWGPGPH